RMESAGDRAGGRAVLNSLSSALFTLVLRAASDSDKSPEGFLALAGHPRLAPAIAAMLADPAQPVLKVPNERSARHATQVRQIRQFPWMGG
ncbi:AraC family transcriptional regulator, partial [Rhizobium johnstonii]